MMNAFALSLAQLGDRRILAVLLKSAVLTLIIVAVAGFGGFGGLNLLVEWLIAGTGAEGGWLGTAGSIAAALLALVLAWLLFRIVAMAVIQFFADEVVRAVELRHYPAAAQAARPLGWRAELAQALRGAARALGYNLLALPFAVLLLVTGIGPAVLFAVVNAVLLGKELDDMVRLRHRDDAGVPLAPLPGFTRFGLGLAVVGLLLVPFVNFIAPLVGAAMATHLVHRRPGGYGARP